jgi:hypothetical protein
MTVAMTLARLGQFDEAIALGGEAVALQRTPRMPRPPYASQLEQILRMKQAAANTSASRVDK